MASLNDTRSIAFTGWRIRSLALAKLATAVIWIAWTLNIGLLGAAVWRVVSDGASLQQVDSLQDYLTHHVPAWGARAAESEAAPTSPPTGPLLLAAGAAATSFVAMFAGLVVGPRAKRRITWWLAFTALTCCWLALGASCRDLYWRGQQWRMGASVAGIEQLACELQRDFPSTDGETEELGYYLVYPKHAPRILLPMNRVEIPSAGLAFSAVERSPDGSLRFELAGEEAGAWLEWRPDGTSPESFQGGLETRYQLAERAGLGRDWWLVRYGASLPKGGL